MKKLALHWQVLIALALGAAYAYFAVTRDWVEFTGDYIQPFGDIFIRLLKLIAAPLVLFSIIAGVTSLKDIRKLGKIGIKTLLLYLATTIFAVGLGLVLVNLLAPGSNQDARVLLENRIKYEVWRDQNAGIERLDDKDVAQDPANAEILERTLAAMEIDESSQNAWVKDKLDKAKVAKKQGPLQPLVDLFPPNLVFAFSDGSGNPSMLQIIVFAIFFGIVLVSLPAAQSAPVLALVEGLSEVFVQMVWVVMRGMPFFVFCLMAGQIVAAAGADPERFRALLDFLLQYSIVVVLGLATMVLVVYPLLVRLLARGMTYGRFLRGMREAQITAFSTSSSVATLPVTMDCVNNKLGVSERTTSFVLPIGATVNMDGTSLYQAVAVVAMAQFHAVDLGIAQQLVIVLTATLASIGAAAIPSAGLVLMIIVLESVNLNPAWIALIFPVDRILDMFRTVVNVTGDAAVSTIVASFEGELDGDIGEAPHTHADVLQEEQTP